MCAQHRLIIITLYWLPHIHTWPALYCLNH